MRASTVIIFCKTIKKQKRKSILWTFQISSVIRSLRKIEKLSKNYLLNPSQLKSIIYQKLFMMFIIIDKVLLKVVFINKKITLITFIQNLKYMANIFNTIFEYIL